VDSVTPLRNVRFCRSPRTRRSETGPPRYRLKCRLRAGSWQDGTYWSLPAPIRAIGTRWPGECAVSSRQSLEIYSRLALTDAQASYDQAIGRFPV